MSFKIGDQVQWTGHAGGYSRRNVGTVVGIIQRHEALRGVLVTMPGALSPRKITVFELPKGYWNGEYRSYRPGASYLVKVGNRTRLYWPHASKLSAVLTPKLLNEAIAASSTAMGKECAKPLFDPFLSPGPDSPTDEDLIKYVLALTKAGDEFLVVARRASDDKVRACGKTSMANGLTMILHLYKHVMELG